MAQLVITIPDAQAARVLDALGRRWGYADTITDPMDEGVGTPNPQTRAVFVREKIARFLKNEAIAQEREEAASAAAEVAQQAAENEVDIS